MSRPHALIVEDDPSSRMALTELVAQEGWAVLEAGTLEEARLELLETSPDVVLTDLMLPDGEGIELLSELADKPSVEVVLITGKATIESAIEALRQGAFDYLTKPLDTKRLTALLTQLEKTRTLKGEISELREQLRELGRFGPLVGTSEAMQTVYDLVEKVAPTDATVLVVGESGTGKELVAHALHDLSTRRGEPLLPVNCGAISPNLIESELFGHEKGAFTGANRRHLGYFERASGGTLFLDEITEMPVELQVKLLRVLETGQFLRVGGTQPIETDVRVLAATNREPTEAVAEGALREDLYFRLRVFPIHLPRLAERDGDIELLADHFLQRFQGADSTTRRLSPEAMTQLEAHDWPGNVRELEHVIRRASILADQVIEPEHLDLQGLGEVDPEADDDRGPRLQVRVGSSIREAEKRLILATLDHLEGDKRHAADILGISLKTLYNRLKRYRSEGEDV